MSFCLLLSSEGKVKTDSRTYGNCTNKIKSTINNSCIQFSLLLFIFILIGFNFILTPALYAFRSLNLSLGSGKFPNISCIFF